MLSFKDITDYYDLSENEATVLRFIINNTSAEPVLGTPVHDQQYSSIDHNVQKSPQKLSSIQTNLN